MKARNEELDQGISLHPLQARGSGIGFVHSIPGPEVNNQTTPLTVVPQVLTEMARIHFSKRINRIFGHEGMGAI